MKKYNIDKVFTFIFKYVWIICALILVLEIFFTARTVILFTHRASEDITEMTKNELENKLNVTWKLADALAQDIVLTNTDIDLSERALYLKPYSEVYSLFLIGITDENGIITSTYDDIPGDIGYRDYFQRVIKTGEAEITDAFPAGADGTTLNYTICVPYFDENDTVKGTIIMSIPFDGINQSIVNASPSGDFMFTLLASDNTVMAENDEDILGKEISEIIFNSKYMSTDRQNAVDSIESGEKGSYWTIDDGRLLYVSYTPIDRTPWKFLTSVEVLSSNLNILTGFVVKAILLVIIFFCIAHFGKKYAAKKLKDASALINQVVKLQTNLREEKLISTDAFEELAEISQSGLLDSLTSLPTRLGIKRQVEKEIKEGKMAAFLLIDLDDMKHINDSYGHEAGDLALQNVARRLKTFSQRFGGTAGRFGGDEFVVYLPGVDDESVVKELAEELRCEYDYNGIHIPVHCSVGMSLFPGQGELFELLYTRADKALYEVKQGGKGFGRLYEEDRSM